MSWYRQLVLTAATFVLLGLPATAVTAAHVPVTEWRSGLTELDQGWVEHEGDKMEWSRPEFDDSGWNSVDLSDLGPAQTGWRWYRRRVHLGPDHGEVRLLISGGEGTCELFVNGIRLAGPTLRSALLVERPVEAVFPVSDANGTFEIALRTRIP